MQLEEVQKSPISSQHPLLLLTEWCCLTQMFAALGGKDVILPFVTELKIASIQLRAVVK